ncbi:ankyrin repeat domain-containing protein [Bradyrhizobium sp. LHD-71]|uniref:ankyrin repeat domain-containing protein n=1 Tax=Bradyrhizobium sp. LHD-71 TaxID=3072141 RepID=UPI00280FAD3E|nr:ankyrin repeat domain-containing protein [Bradyrhizobium sp. LHD-71]MDQ8730955.1 ankyrin repeat domain-containing protein [Bradyrhizobium sp. LHD-71]
MPDKDRLAPDLVNEFVSKAHGDLDRVRRLLAEYPMLVNAAWDWGGGDWETGLGAAAHVGRRDIALCLIEHGARMDIFAAAMLGYLPIVRAMLEAIPHARTWKGPHGIALLTHAEAGGPMAAPVADFLRTPAHG